MDCAANLLEVCGSLILLFWISKDRSDVIWNVDHRKLMVSLGQKWTRRQWDPEEGDGWWLRSRGFGFHRNLKPLGFSELQASRSPLGLRDCPAPCERTQCSFCELSAASKVYSVPQTCLVSVPRSSIHHPFCARSFKGALEMMGALPIWMQLFHRMLPTLGPRRSGRREVESLPKIQAGKAGAEKVLGKRMGV